MLNDNVTEPIMLAGSIILAIAILTLSLFIAREARSTGTKAYDKIEEVSLSISENDVVKYDQQIVSGSDVISCVKKYSKKFPIIVYKAISDKYSYDEIVKDADGAFRSIDSLIVELDSRSVQQEGRTQWCRKLSFTSPSSLNNVPQATVVSDYLNPGAKFQGIVVRNSNDGVDKILFIQKNFVNDAQLVDSSGGSSGGGSGESTDAIGSGIVSSLNSITQSVSVLQQSIVSISQKLDRIESGSLGGPVETPDDVSQSISDLREQLNLLSEKVNSIPDDTTNSEKIDELESRLSDLSEQFKLLSEAVNGVEGDEDSVSLIAKINSLEVSLETLEEKVSKLNKLLEDEGDNSSEEEGDTSE